MKAVTLFRVVPVLLFLTLTISISSRATTSFSEPKVKLSASGICHDKSSASFNRTKNYQAFDSVVICIAQGGRSPKAKTNSRNNATDEAIEQGRASLTLYNRGE